MHWDDHVLRLNIKRTLCSQDPARGSDADVCGLCRGTVSAAYVRQIGAQQAALMAMTLAVDKLRASGKCPVDYILVDGQTLPKVM